MFVDTAGKLQILSCGTKKKIVKKVNVDLYSVFTLHYIRKQFIVA